MTKPKRNAVEQKLPSRNLERLAERLFDNLDERADFVAAVCEPKSYPEAIIWVHKRPKTIPFVLSKRLDFQPEFVDRVDVRGGFERPGKSALHESGDIYCLDFSSVFAASVLSGAISDEHELIIDLCASPGGKAVFSWAMFRPQILVCNEVIKKRLGALTGNLKRCRVSPCMVISYDVSRVKDAWAKTASLVLVDAPCSGQSLLVRGLKAPACFHPATINLNSNRQKRILANAAPLLKPGGYLAYMTCTYSPEENEKVVEWLLEKMPYLQPVSVPSLLPYQSHLSTWPAYRLFPQSGLGAGAFAVLLRSSEEGEAGDFEREALRVMWSSK